MILAGDVGGTKAVLAFFEEEGSELRERADATYRSRDYGSLEEIVEAFLREHGPRNVQAACFGVPGVVEDGRAKTTNLPWQIEESALASACGAPRAKLMNDLEAAAYGMLLLRSDEFAVLRPGARASRPGNAAVIAAGTGLGQAFLVWTGDRHVAVATEGGHADFAPRTEREIRLLRYLRGRYGRVSYERVLAGSGLADVYRFLRGESGEPEPPWLRERLDCEDPGSVVGRVALERGDPVCADALDVFVEAYGAEAGNMALRCLAVGGVYVGGGIAPKILPALRRGGFARAFADKGRFTGLLETIPVGVALNPRAPLLGAADQARRL